jgi:hypothetical protein
MMCLAWFGPIPVILPALYFVNGIYETLISI